jgi:dephospho-CoA kinase
MNPAGEVAPVVIGVTGNIACGKSAVLAILRDLGAATIDADEVYADLVRPEGMLLGALADRFGPEIVAADGTLDRRALAAIAFADPAALAALDRITHPAVVAEVARRIRQQRAPVVAIDAVKLVESGMVGLCDALWVVTCDPEVQIARLMARNGFDRAEAERRIAAQPPLEDKLAMADAVIDNSRDLAALRTAVAAAWVELPAMLDHHGGPK